jgi:hypothetical protein
MLSFTQWGIQGDLLHDKVLYACLDDTANAW